MNRMNEIRQLFERLQRAAEQIDQTVHFMEVCGTHTMSAFRCGLPSLLPENVKLLSGPGCPVCVTAQGDIDALIELARRDGVVLCTYGDMLRVPGEQGSLELARSEGADIRVVYSVLDALQIAQLRPDEQVIFASVGFETTTPATAVAILQARCRNMHNFSVLASHKLIIPAMRALLESGDVPIDGFLCPGHVSVIIGADAYRPIFEEYNRRCVISGFEDHQMVATLVHLTEQVCNNKVLLENLYPEAVTSQGNVAAWDVIDRVFEPTDVCWRGLGVLPDSGLQLRETYRDFDARQRFDLDIPERQEMPGCRCGDVITARCTPPECKLFERVCTPVNPIGPCMVSSEGTCQAWFKYHRGSVRKAYATEFTETV